MVGSAAMAEVSPTPTIRAQAFMMSSSDINDLDDYDSEANRAKRPRPSTPFCLPSPSSSDTSPKKSQTPYDDILYDHGAAQRLSDQGQTSVFADYVDGKRVHTTPANTLEEKDRRARENDLRDNAAAQAKLPVNLPSLGVEISLFSARRQLPTMVVASCA
jgi:hypothetical protein